MIVDRVKARVFFNLYKGGPEKRPVVEIIKSQLPDLFNLFDDRYRDQLWEASEPYDTLSSSSKDAPHPL